MPARRLTALAIAAATVALPTSADADSVVVSVGGLKYRVQALSPTLLRLEAEGPLGGFEDRATFFAQNRSWAGVAITAHSFGFNATTLSTASWSLELSAGPPPDTDAAAAGLGGSTCGNAMEGGVKDGVKLAGAPPPATAADAPTECCAACDAAAGCTAWVWTPALAAPPPSPPGPHGGGGKGPLRAAPCVANREGQIWQLAGTRGDNHWASVESANGKKNGCWEITGCSRTEVRLLSAPIASFGPTLTRS